MMWPLLETAYQHINKCLSWNTLMVHPGKLTWNPEIPPLEKEVSISPNLQTTTFGVQNVTFQECTRSSSMIFSHLQSINLLRQARGITPLAPHFGSDRQGVVSQDHGILTYSWWYWIDCTVYFCWGLYIWKNYSKTFKTIIIGIYPRAWALDTKTTERSMWVLDSKDPNPNKRRWSLMFPLAGFRPIKVLWWAPHINV